MRLVVAVAGLLFAAVPASAQYYGPRPAVPIGPPSAYDVAEIVQAMGLDPIGPPGRSGAVLCSARKGRFRPGAECDGRCAALAGDRRRGGRARKCAVWSLCGLRALSPGTSGLCGASARRRGRFRSPGLDHGRARAASRGRADAALCCRDAASRNAAASRCAKARGEIRDRDAGAAQAPRRRAAGGRRIGRAGARTRRRRAARAGSLQRQPPVTPLE